MVQYLILKVL